MRLFWMALILALTAPMAEAAIVNRDGPTIVETIGKLLGMGALGVSALCALALVFRRGRPDD